MSRQAAAKKMFAERNAASATGRSETDAWRQYLLASGAKGDGSITDLEKRWLRVKGGTGQTLTELWSSYLDSKGYAGGRLADRKRRFFESGTQA